MCCGSESEEPVTRFQTVFYGSGSRSERIAHLPHPTSRTHHPSSLLAQISSLTPWPLTHIHDPNPSPLSYPLTRTPIPRLSSLPNPLLNQEVDPDAYKMVPNPPHCFWMSRWDTSCPSVLLQYILSILRSPHYLPCFCESKASVCGIPVSHNCGSPVSHSGNRSTHALHCRSHRSNTLWPGLISNFLKLIFVHFLHVIVN